MIDEPDEDAVWIKSEPDDDGTYHVYLELGPDDVIPIDSAAAYGWAREVLSAVAQAEYDAAVLAQAVALGLGDDAAAELVIDLRADRAEHVPVSLIPGLALIPGVSQATRKGFLRLERHGKAYGQWEPDDARRHALGIIEAFEVSILDSAYLRLLQHRIGAPPDTARAAVGALAKYRD